MIYIAGLGPGDMGLLTIETFSLLRETRVILRTRIHPTVSALDSFDITYETMDEFYEKDMDFNDVYMDIAKSVVSKYKEGNGDLTYCVPGNPMMAEKSVLYLIDILERENIDYEIKPAVSFVDTIISQLKVDPIGGLSIIDALDINDKEITKDNDLIITQVYNTRVAGEVKLRLSNFMDDEATIKYIRAAGVKGEATITDIKLYELDRQKDVDHLTTLYIHKGEINDGFFDFKKTVDALRSPGGCPWDLEQTHESLKRYLIEEAYEVIDAINENDDDHLKEELGDVLLQVLLHSRIKEEEGLFTVYDVIRNVNEKMISRHPHVFKDSNLGTSEEVLVNWEKLKKQEDGNITLEDKLKKISKSIPAFIRALEVAKKAKQYGVPKRSSDELINKLKALISKGESLNEAEVIEMIFLITMLADAYKLEPETALNLRVDQEINRLITENR